MQVSRWGNSLAVRLPSEVVEALNLKEGDQIEIRIASTREFEVRRDPCPTAGSRTLTPATPSFAGGVRIRPGRGECPLNIFSTPTY